jgi:hypothetical protein
VRAPRPWAWSHRCFLKGPFRLLYNRSCPAVRSRALLHINGHIGPFWVPNLGLASEFFYFEEVEQWCCSGPNSTRCLISIMDCTVGCLGDDTKGCHPQRLWSGLCQIYLGQRVLAARASEEADVLVGLAAKQFKKILDDTIYPS